MSKIISGAEPCDIILEFFGVRSHLHYCKTHNYRFSSRKRQLRKCPIGRQGKKAQMHIWTEKEAQETLSK